MFTLYIVSFAILILLLIFIRVKKQLKSKLILILTHIFEPYFYFRKRIFWNVKGRCASEFTTLSYNLSDRFPRIKFVRF